MSWQEKDDRKERGKIDRIYVSPTENYELHYFVDHYLKTNNFEVNDKNRQIICDEIENYPGNAPIQRYLITAYLNKKFKNNLIRFPSG